MMGSGPRLADSHIHLFQFGYHGDASENEEVERYESFRATFTVGPALVVGYEGEERFSGNNHYISQLAQQRDWMYPLRYLGRESIPGTGESNFHGLALYLGEWHGSSDVGRALRAAASELSSSRPLVSINGTPDMFADATDSLLQSGDYRMLVSHLGLPGLSVSNTQEATERLGPILRLAGSIELYVKISGLYAVDSSAEGSVAARYVEALLNVLGPERLLWGSDFTPVLDHRTPEEAFTLPPEVMSLLSDADQMKVLCTNLSTLLSS